MRHDDWTTHPRAHALQQEKPVQQEAHVPQPEKTCAQQQRIKKLKQVKLK